MKVLLLSLLLLTTSVIVATPPAAACGLKSFHDIGDCLDDEMDAVKQLRDAELSRVICIVDPHDPRCP